MADNRPRTQRKTTNGRGTRGKARVSLLKAAGPIFARSGYRAAGVREICDTAGVNISAIKYHFGSKEDLYREVLLTAHRQMLERLPMPQVDAIEDAEKALHDWVKWFLELLLRKRPNEPLIGRLMAHEMADPTPVLQDLVAQSLAPVRESITRIVSKLLERHPSDPIVRESVAVIFGLCVNYNRNRPLMAIFRGEVRTSSASIQRLAAVISELALGGLERILTGTMF